MGERLGDVPGEGRGEGTADGRADVRLLFLCTGNAARSVMAGYMFEWLATAKGLGAQVTTAGTHVAEGQPMSMRTRAALATIPELAEAPVHLHRSHQLTEADLSRADMVVAMEADHVRYVRRRHPGAATRTATLRRLCRDLPPGPPSLPARLAGLALGGTELGIAEDVLDPAGGDDERYVDCATQLWRLCRQLATKV